ncbi:MAG: hypothetical protein GC131_09085 [Alphaproteobacteria bacterium]|nr:hypothetical protein [Alphaproteobacteria bacterium]
MASILLSTAGNALAPGIGGSLFALAGGALGSVIDRQIFGFSGPRIEGPRLENLKVQDSRYGAGIPLAWGRVRVAGNVIWSSDLIEARHEEQSGGGKGGFGASSSVTTVRYSYSVNCAVAVCAGPVQEITAVWADGKLVYDGGGWKAGLAASAGIYTGTAAQTPDAVMEAALGAGNVPGYRGIAYIVFEGLQLADFGNRIPNLTFEVLASAADPAPVWDGEAAPALSTSVISLHSHQGNPPLRIAGDSTRTTRLIVGGYVNPGASCQYQVVEYDVTGTAPALAARTSSDAFASSAELYDHSWGMAPDGRYAAILALNDDGTGNVMIYDSALRIFGAPVAVTLTGALRQIAWIGPLHFVLSEVSGGVRGVRLFMRAGLGIIDLGFSPVWGAGSDTSRPTVGHAQFIPAQDGLLFMTGNSSFSPTALYLCHIRLAGNAVAAGAPYTLSASVPSGSAAQTSLLDLGGGETLLTFSLTFDARVLSFRADAAGATITRGWTSLGYPTGAENCTPELLGPSRLLLIVRFATESNYRILEATIGDSGFTLLSSEGEIVGGYEAAVDSHLCVRIDHNRLALQDGAYSTDMTSALGLITRSGGGDTLQNVVDAILDRAGYDAADYDTDALADETLAGYVLPGPLTARDAIEPLRSYRPFDLVESGASLRADLRGGTAGETVPDSELRAAEDDDEPPPALEQVRRQELDLPAEVTVDHIDPARAYEIGSQRARRITGAAQAVKKLALPVVCDAAAAKQVAETTLFAAWAERDMVKFRATRKYLTLEPGDVVSVGGRTARLTLVRQRGGMVEAEGLLVSADAYASAAVAEGGEAAQRRDVAAVPSYAFLMDLPLLTDNDDQPGMYAAISGAAGWPGGALWRAPDTGTGGVDFAAISGFPLSAAAGAAADVLADAPAHYMDRAGSVTVQLFQGTLSSCSETALLDGGNAALLGDEIIQFQTATLAGPGLYTLTNLLRGRRATGWASASHTAGERFVLLQQNSTQFLPAQLSDRGRTYQFRALSTGQSLGDVQDTAFTYGLRTIEPFAPAHLAGTRADGPGGDLTITWKRRARLNAAWVDEIDVPLDEAEELYDIEIMDGTDVKRAFSVSGTSAKIYSAAEQTADWGTAVPASFTVRASQRSNRFGRGQTAEAAL